MQSMIDLTAWLDEQEEGGLGDLRIRQIAEAAIYRLYNRGSREQLRIVTDMALSCERDVKSKDATDDE